VDEDGPVAGSRFLDRVDAGRQLAGALAHHRGTGALVLGLPRGGVPVAAEVAAALDADLDVLVVRKLGVPGHEELAMGAVAGGGLRVLNPDVLSRLDLPAAVVDGATARAARVVADRERAYRGDLPPLEVWGRRVLLVDDGLATGATMRVAVQAVTAGGASPVVVAVPVAPPSACREMRLVADEVVCLHTPASFLAVGAWYDDFSETSDDEVRAALGGVA
jgi:putative phosphoribosyl transferase